MRSFYGIFLLLLLLSGLTLSVFSQDKSKIIENLSQKADLIVTGKVTEKQSGWNDTKTRIYTTVTVQIDEKLKGNQGENSVDITYPGGEVGEVGELYTHMPTFEEREDVLVFLKKDGKNNGYKVMNGSEGKLTVFEDPVTGEKVTGSHIRIKELKKQISSYLGKQ